MNTVEHCDRWRFSLNANPGSRAGSDDGRWWLVRPAQHDAMHPKKRRSMKDTSISERDSRPRSLAGFARIGLKLCIALSLAICATACARTDPPATDPALVKTDRGPVRGTIESGVVRFQGIAYARPPIGALRWQRPQPPAPWTRVHEANRPGPICAQADEHGRLAADSSEDCLYLNVVAPTRPAVKARAVLVWLHGGRFSSGAGSDYDPKRWVELGDLVVVTVNSRLGVFGFFGHPDLPDSGNYGLADQQAALRWVRDNIAAFGGDPLRVILAGQSSGSISVCGQLASPAAAGLFQRAILQSGPCRLGGPGELTAPGDGASKLWFAREVLQQRGRHAAGYLAEKPACADPDALDCLRRVSTTELLALNGPFHSPAYGTPLLPIDPVAALRSGRFNRVPVMQGITRNEHRLFTPLFDFKAGSDDGPYRAQLRKAFDADRAAAIASEYPLARYGSPALAWAAMDTDYSAACPALQNDRDLMRYVPVYAYEFADPHPPGADEDAGFALAAYHGSELPSLFDMGPSYAALNAEQRELARSMIGYWSRFAANGDPNATDAPHWPKFDGRNALSLAPDRIGPIDFADDHRCEFWQAK
ncbi:MAG: carboxylesterase/lipase family protein [Lysobacter sp.]